MNLEKTDAVGQREGRLFFTASVSEADALGVVTQVSGEPRRVNTMKRSF